MFVCNNRPRFGTEQLRFNYTKNTDFVKLLKNITSQDQKLWFDQHRAMWNMHANPPHFETLNSLGIGYTFNLLDDLLNFDL